MVRRTWRPRRGLALAGLLAAALPACGGEGEGGDTSGGASGAGTAGTSAGSGMGGAGSGMGGAGASGGGSGGGGGGEPDAALTAFCAQVRATQVSRRERCNGLAPEIAQVFVPIDPCAVWGPAVQGARMAFDPAADAGACVTALQALSCDADALPASCGPVLFGLRAPGEGCAFAVEPTGFSECEVGTACVGALLGSMGCEGTCVERSLLGQACNRTQPCTSGSTCTVDRGCAPKGSSGSACGLTSSPECAEGLFCSDILDGGSCIAHLGLGAVCSGQPGDCAPPAVCERGASLTGTCELPKKPGDSCVNGDYECGSGFAYCGADGTCHGLAKLGEPCTNTDGEGTDCMVGTCDTTLATPVCVPGVEGDICFNDADCTPGSICLPNFDGGRCGPVCF